VKQIRPKTQLKGVIVTNVKEYFPGIGKFLFTVAKEKKEGHRVEALVAGDSWFQDILTKYAGRKPDVDALNRGLDQRSFQS
jgi:hypothetical protein